MILEEIIEFTPILKCERGLSLQLKYSVKPLCPHPHLLLLWCFPGRGAVAPLLRPEVLESLVSDARERFNQVFASLFCVKR